MALMLAGMAASTIFGAIGSHGAASVAAANQKMAQAQQFQTASQRVEAELRGIERQSILQGKQNVQLGKADLNTLLNTNFMTGLVNVQKGAQRVENVKSGIDVKRQRALAMGQAEAGAAASGTIGHSVDAVIGDIEEKTGRALGEIDRSWETQQLNYASQIRNMYVGYDQNQAIVDDSVADLPNIPTPPKYRKGPSFGQALAGAAIQTAGDYFGAKMGLELGAGASNIIVGSNVQSSLGQTVNGSSMSSPSFSARL